MSLNTFYVDTIFIYATLRILSLHSCPIIMMYYLPESCSSSIWPACQPFPFLRPYSAAAPASGSRTLPSSAFLVKIRGGDMMSSNPSLLICSINIPNCNSPLPKTVVFSLTVSEFMTVIVTLLSVSANNLARIRDDVTLFPSFPANGPVLDPKSIQSVGGARGGVSTGCGTALSLSVTVSPTAMESGTPNNVTISPATA